MEKRQYQEDAISEVLATGENTLLVSPTGSGKTYMAKRIIQQLEDRVLFVTPRIDLVTQTAEAFDYDCDILWKNYKDTGKHVTVASRQTLQRRELDLHEFVAIFDEVHIGLQSTKELCDKFNFKRVIGLTATPERMDGKSFVKGNGTTEYNKDRYDYAIFDRVVTAGTIKSLQEQGYLSHLEYCVVPKSRDLSKLKTKFDELKYDQIKDVVEANEQVVNLCQFLKAHEDKKPYIVFTPDVESAYHWRDTLNDFGYNLKAIDGSTKKEERDEIYKEAKEGKIDGIVNCALLTYGFDLPCAKTAVLIRNIKSRSLYIQVIGRILRPFENKDAIVYDMGGSNWNFCKLKAPNLFASEIDYKIEGTDYPKKEKFDDIEAIRNLVGDENVVPYIEDPLGTLLALLNVYKEDFELNILNSKKAEFEAKKKVELVASENMKLREQLTKKVQAAGEVDFRTMDFKYWAKNYGFEWVRRNVPHILKSIGYDKKYYGDKEWEKKVLTEVANEVPVTVKDGDFFHFEKTMTSLLKWWMQRFELGYTRETQKEKEPENTTSETDFTEFFKSVEE